MIKKKIVLGLAISLLLSGCSKNNLDSNIATTSTTKETGETTLSKEKQEENLRNSLYASSGSMARQYYSKKDGVYGLYSIPYKYDNRDIEVGLEVEATLENREDKFIDTDIEIYTVVICNNEFVENSIDNSEKKLINKITVPNKEGMNSMDISFTPEGLQEEGEMKAAVGFFYKPVNYYINDDGQIDASPSSFPFKYDDFTVNYTILANGSSLPQNKLEVRNDNKIVPLKEDGTNDEIDYIYDNAIMNYGGNGDDHIIIERNGVYELIARYDADYATDNPEDYEEYRTVLICDGEVYPAFDGEYVYPWRIEKGNTMTKALDLSGLSKGKHEIFTFSYGINENTGIVSLYKNIEIE